MTDIRTRERALRKITYPRRAERAVTRNNTYTRKFRYVTNISSVQHPYNFSPSCRGRVGTGLTDITRRWRREITKSFTPTEVKASSHAPRAHKRTRGLFEIMLYGPAHALPKHRNGGQSSSRQHGLSAPAQPRPRPLVPADACFMMGPEVDAITALHEARHRRRTDAAERKKNRRDRALPRAHSAPVKERPRSLVHTTIKHGTGTAARPVPSEQRVSRRDNSTLCSAPESGDSSESSSRPSDSSDTDADPTHPGTVPPQERHTDPGERMASAKLLSPRRSAPTVTDIAHSAGLQR